MWDMQNIRDLILNRALRQAPDEHAIGDDSSGDIGEIYPPINSIEQANIVTSALSNNKGPFNFHYPILDIDYDAHLVPSSTEGHYHLYLNMPVPWRQYKKVLRAMKDAGLIQDGFYRAAIKRGFTSARLPWIKKEEKVF